MLTVFKAVVKDFQQTSLLRLKVSITSYLSSEMERTHGRHACDIETSELRGRRADAKVTALPESCLFQDSAAEK